MCGICGCSDENTPVQGHGHGHSHAQGHSHGEGHSHEHSHSHAHGHSHGEGHSHGHTDETAAHHVRRIAVETDILSKNRTQAQHNRALFAQANLTVLNMLSGPGAGKTTLLVKLLSALKGRCPLAVVEGDQYTALDAERVAETGVPALQINTGKGCHLDAHQLAHALPNLPLPPSGLLFVENVGNLVCPAAFDLGETARLVLLSLTEGEDKPLKYADTFSTAHAVLLTKADLAPYLEVSVDAFTENLRKVCPHAPVFLLSAQTGQGLEPFLLWLEALRLSQTAS